MTPNQSAARIT